MPNPTKDPKPMDSSPSKKAETARNSTRSYPCPGKPEASAHAPPHAIGRPASRSSLPTPRQHRKREKVRRTRRRPPEISTWTGGSACIVPRTRPLSGGPGPWAPRRSAMPAGSDTSRAGSCRSIDPLPARLLC